MSTKRVVKITLFLFILYSLLIIQYFKIQIVEHKKWEAYASRQHELILPQVAKRGSFFGKVRRCHLENAPVQPLVYDVIKFHLYADTHSLPDEKKQEIACYLSDLIEVDRESILTQLNRLSRSRKIEKWLSPNTKDSIEIWWKKYCCANKIPKNALFFLKDFRRSYPFGSLLGQVLHTIREQKDEFTKQGVPTGGLESYFHSLIKGEPGKRILLRSPLNRIDSDRLVTPAVDGADIYLTIDPYIQQIVEEELCRGVHEAKALAGWAVMMDSASGEILALGQYPPFNLDQYQDYFNDPKKIEQTKVRALTDCFEVGSIMKPITLGVALIANKELKQIGREPLFSSNEKISVSRRQFPGRGNKPIQDGVDRNFLDMDMSIQRSSNIYMAQLAERVVNQMGNEWYKQTLTQCFGFGLKTGLELPAESRGFVPSPGKIYPNGCPQWSSGTPYSLSFGYNLLANSVQMLRAIAVFANGGKLVYPTLVSDIVKEGHSIMEHKQEKPKQVLDKACAKRVVESLKFSTKPGGTGWRADIPGYTKAGKTGTAEKIISGKYSKKIHISSFVGFSPAESIEQMDPIVLIVSLDEPAPILVDGIKNYLGGKCSAPVFKRIMQRTLEYLGVPPDDPYGFSKEDPRFDPKKADYFSKVAELQKKYKEWNG